MFYGVDLSFIKPNTERQQMWSLEKYIIYHILYMGDSDVDDRINETK